MFRTCYATNVSSIPMFVRQRFTADILKSYKKILCNYVQFFLSTLYMEMFRKIFKHFKTKLSELFITIIPNDPTVTPYIK